MKEKGKGKVASLISAKVVGPEHSLPIIYHFFHLVSTSTGKDFMGKKPSSKKNSFKWQEHFSLKKKDLKKLKHGLNPLSAEGNLHRNMDIILKSRKCKVLNSS